MNRTMERWLAEQRERGVPEFGACRPSRDSGWRGTLNGAFACSHEHETREDAAACAMRRWQYDWGRQIPADLAIRAAQ